MWLPTGWPASATSSGTMISFGSSGSGTRPSRSSGRLTVWNVTSPTGAMSAVSLARFGVPSPLSSTIG